MTRERASDPYRWVILALATLTNAIVVAAPGMALSVLFEEIQRDLNLTLVEVGFIWSISALPGLFVSLLGGALGDRFGPKRLILLVCLTAGVLGALRGWSADFLSLVVLNSLLGGVLMLVPLSGFKACGMWFSRRQLGLANGVLSIGMAGGFLVGSLVSATWLSPWLGGWRNVLIFYGALSLALVVPWLLTRAAPPALTDGTSTTPATAPMFDALAAVSRLRSMWLLGLVLLGLSGCMQGTLGYLPLYLRGAGWEPAVADSALALFHTVSLVFTLPIALGSDRLGSRKRVLLAALVAVVLGVGGVGFVTGSAVWAAVVLAGFVRDGFMAIYMTAVVEVEGVGPRYAGTATGFVMVFASLGNLLAPPIGNTLADLGPGVPFWFWAGLALTALVILTLVPERERAQPVAAVAEPA
ncbi:MAG: MFS transporter [Anaerolineales bacterium]|nr:MFS transporter [Anaerolineales bacterium]